MDDLDEVRLGGHDRLDGLVGPRRLVDHAFILEGYARRWTIEVAFYTQKQFLGFEDPQNQTPEAVARTAPLAGLVYDLVLLWYAARVQQGRAPDWLARPWYRSKATPSFLDMLTAVVVAFCALTALATGRGAFVDVALGAALINFVSTCAFATFLERRRGGR